MIMLFHAYVSTGKVTPVSTSGDLITGCKKIFSLVHCKGLAIVQPRKKENLIFLTAILGIIFSLLQFWVKIDGKQELDIFGIRV